MRRNDIDFTLPRRQSYVAILLIIINTYKNIIKQFWYIAVAFLFGKSTKTTILIAIGIISVIALVISIWRYFKYYFYISDEELIIEKGILQTKRLSVPFERIQTINFEQSIIHRVFDAIKITVDTAGSKEEEFTFQALDRETAEALRDLLIRKKSMHKATAVDEEEEIMDVAPPERTIFSLSVGELLKAGMVENHIRSGGVILAGVFWVYNNLQDIGYQGKVEDGVKTYVNSFMILVYLMVLFLILSFLISVVRMVITNYNLRFLRLDNGFKIKGGLFTQRVVSAMDNKIQLISWSDNPLKKLIGIKDLYLKQASSVATSLKKSIKVPGISLNHIEEVFHALYGNQSEIENYKPVHPSYFFRVMMYLTLFVVPIIAVLIYFKVWTFLTIVLLVYTFIVVSRYLKYKKLRYGDNGEIIIIKGGAFGDKSSILPIYKIQGVTKSQSPYQRRKNLTSLLIYTAAGSVTIPYIPKDEADRYVDTLLYKVEVSKKDWM